MQKKEDKDMSSVLSTVIECLMIVGVQCLFVWILAGIFSKLNDKMLPDDED